MVLLMALLFVTCPCRPLQRWASSSRPRYRRPVFLWVCWVETYVPVLQLEQVTLMFWEEFFPLVPVHHTDRRNNPSLSSGKTAAFVLPVLERLVYKPRTSQVTRVLVLVPTRELGIQVHSVARQLAQFTSITTCLAVGTTGYSLLSQHYEPCLHSALSLNLGVWTPSSF